jgi:hypothetical protein
MRRTQACVVLTAITWCSDVADHDERETDQTTTTNTLRAYTRHTTHTRARAHTTSHAHTCNAREQISMIMLTAAPHSAEPPKKTIMQKK